MSEHKLITPRRNFLIRALGFTAAGATVSIPVLVTETPQQRLDFHLAEIAQMIHQQDPEATQSGRTRVLKGCLINVAVQRLEANWS